MPFDPEDPQGDERAVNLTSQPGGDFNPAFEDRVLTEAGFPFAPAEPETIELRGRRVRLHPVSAFFPSLDPTGRKVVSSQAIPGEQGFRRLVVSNLDGSEVRAIHDAEGQVFSVSWSPDGAWIAFAEGVVFATEDVGNDIWRVRPEGSAARNLTESGWNDAFPDFSGDAGRIVFRSGRDGEFEIYSMAVDGSDPKRLTRRSGKETMPAISPDGTFLVFVADTQGRVPQAPDFDLFSLQLDAEGRSGSSMPAWIPGLFQITKRPGREMHPRFAPGPGWWIVFTASWGGFNDEPVLSPGPQPYGELWAQPVDPDEGPAIRLTHNKWEDGLPDWGRFAEAASPGSEDR